jgi:hypothetical protein
MKAFFVFLLSLLLLAIPMPIQADVAPPAQPPGANLQPGQEVTQVRMLAETVQIEVKPGAGASLGLAQVTADFTMRNQGMESEVLAVRFPTSANDGFFNYPEIQNLRVQVNGKSVRTRRIQGEDPYFGSDLVPWAEFEATFTPGNEVQIRVTYQLEGTGYPPFVSFNYILSTGAGWKDTIGSVDIIVMLPYEANIHNVLLAGDTGYAFTSPRAVLNGKEIRWHFVELEPTREDNLEIELVSPAMWQKALREQDNLTLNPNDGEAWGRLGKVFKEIAFLPKELRPDAGGQALYDLAMQAYQKCLALRPNDAAWHAGFAELYYWRYNTTFWMDHADDTNLKNALDLLKKAIEINPKTPKAIEMLDDITAFHPGYVVKDGNQYVFMYLTATPVIAPSQTAPATQTPTSAPSATALPPTAQPTQSTSPTATAPGVTQPTPTPDVDQPVLATPTPVATGKPGPSLCGTALLLPLLVLTLPLGSRWRKGRLLRKR